MWTKYNKAHINNSSSTYKLENVRIYCSKFLSSFVQKFSNLVLTILFEFFCQHEGNNDTGQIMEEIALANIFLHIRHALAKI